MAELTVPRVDFSSLGELPQVYRQAQADALRKQTLASLGKGGAVDAATLIKSGDMSLAQLGVQLQNRQAEDSWRREEATRSQRNADRSFDFTRSQAQEKATIQRVKDADGNETLVRVLPDGTAMPIETGVNKVGGNPFNSGGKFNEGQGKAAGFTDRMLRSEGILSGVAVPEGSQGPTTPGVQEQGTSATQAGLSKIPGVGNYLVSNDRQKFEQAKRDFINAQLRRESGAAISPSEFESADKQYFPVPGDKPEVIRQKEANRRASIEALGREGGPSYRPKSNFAPDGGVRPNAPAPDRPISKTQYDALPSGTPFTAPDGSRRVKP
jgi:hypothetical protein